MTFLHPLFLLGAGAVAVPVLIHLVFKMPARVVAFPSVRFLREIERRVSRRKRLEDLLVLVARCTLLALVALALAAPVLRTGAGASGSSGTAVVIVLDDSYSMGLRDAEGPVFARGRGLALSILRTLGPGDAACVLTSRREPTLTHDLGALGAELGRLEPSAGAGTLRPLVDAGLALLEKTDAVRRELYVVSDFQRRACDLEGLEAAVRDGTIVLVPVTPTRRENVAVVALEQLSPFATTSAPVRVRATVANRGSELATRTLRIRLDERVVSEQLVSVPAGGSTSQVASVALDTAGTHVVAAEIDPDALPADDRRLLVVDASARLRVLVLRPEAEGVRSRSFYLERALNPGGAADTGVEVVVRDLEGSASRGAGDEADDLESFACVFVVEGVPADEGTRNALARAVARGRSVVFVVGPETPAGELEGAFGAEARRDVAATGDLGPLAPARLAGATLGDPARPETYERIREVDVHHPVFARLARGETPIDLGSASFYRVPRVEAETSRGARVLARFSSGSPAIVERAYGLGRTVLIASPLHGDSTNLPLRVSFLPLVHSLLAYLSVPGGPEGLLVGERAALRVPSDGAPETARLLRSDKAAVEARRELRGVLASYDFGLVRDLGVLSFEWVSPERIETRAFAANTDPDEGTLTYVEPAKALPGAVVVSGAEELQAFVARTRHGRALSPALALAALACILLEALLANRFAFPRPRP